MKRMGLFRLVYFKISHVSESFSVHVVALLEKHVLFQSQYRLLHVGPNLNIF